MIKFDTVDRRILGTLQKKGDLKIREIAEIVGLSYTATYSRILKLQDSGIIDGYVAILDRRTIGLKIMAYVKLKIISKEAFDRDRLEKKLTSLDEIKEIVAVSGQFDYILKILCKDMDELNMFLCDRISSIPNIKRFESSVVFSEIKMGNSIPITTF